MRKILDFLSNKGLFIASLFLLAFIPLYPKLPILKVSHTWVYVRIEDILVLSIFTFWIFLILLRKVKLKTPLTIPILIFWIVGAISTFHGVLVLFPTLANVFSNVAFLSYLRRIEYLSIFFIAFSGFSDKKYINYVIWVLTAILIFVVFYGFGQRILGFPAYLTGNEEFAKGVALRLSSLSRISSTFGGDYDLAGYLVLVIPIIVGVAFAFKNLLLKLFLLLTAGLGFSLLFMTVSRISFFALLISLIVLLILQRKKWIIVFLFLVTFVFLIFSPSLTARFGRTVSDIDVLVNANTGEALGQIREVPREYFKDKLVLRPNASAKDTKSGNSLAVIPYFQLSPTVELLVKPNAPSGENLPQGTGYINLPLSPIVKRTGEYFVEDLSQKTASTSAEERAHVGHFIIKKGRAYDLSFTTRFQGEWPKTIDAFRRNVFLGSGYGSVGLAVDNNYLRILGESGLIGFISFISIFAVAWLYIKRIFPKIDSPVHKSFILGFITGSLGLLVNAFLIDIFEASKIAFTYWILMGFSLGLLSLYQTEEIDVVKQLKKSLISPNAIIIYFSILVLILFFPMIGNFFVGDDFTWLRWVADSKANLISYFTHSNGFFYRPGARIYFSAMYNLFWLNQTFYHLVSIFLHFLTATLLFFLLNKIFKNYTLSIIGTILFIALSGYHETIFWISATGFLFNAVFALASILFYILWREKRKSIYITASLVSIALGLTFHELGVVSPLLIIGYDLIFAERDPSSRKTYLILLSPLLPYTLLRLISNSHWFSGDYNYNILKLPFNFAGNAIGYFILDLFGPQSLNFYENLRNILKGNLALGSLFTMLIVLIFIFLIKKISKIIIGYERKIVIFGVMFFLISLLPFLGLGNITSRYSYLSSIGFAIVLAVFVKKGFSYLLTLGDRKTFSLILILLSMIFLSFQLFQLQKSHSDWEEAGKKTETFLVSFEAVYKDYWVGRPIHFYFVDTPIKNGQAWVFPVGLRDAIWFVLRNENIKVDNVSSLESAFFSITDPQNSSVFKFDTYGQAKEYERSSDNKITPIQ